MPKSKHQIKIDRYFGKQSIAYQPGLGIIFDSPATGIFISQLLYWHGKGSDRAGWIFKTIPEMEKETGLSRYQQETAIRKCVAFGFLETKLTGRVPRTRHFRLDMPALEELIPGMMKTHGLEYLKTASQSAVKQQTNTEITTKNTAQNTTHLMRTKKKLADEKGF